MPRFWVDIWVQPEKVTVHMSKSILVVYVSLMIAGAFAIVGALAYLGSKVL